MYYLIHRLRNEILLVLFNKYEVHEILNYR